MIISRFVFQDKIHFGILKEGNQILLIKNPFETEGKVVELSNHPLNLSEVRLLAPVVPTKIVAVGLNYVDHAKELDMDIPDEPVIFIKPSTAVIGPEERIILPPQSKRVDYEAELAVVIGKEARFVSLEKARDFIFGYTCSNDVTARDLQKKDIQWTRAKSFDTFAPLGPWIVTDIEPDDLKIELFLNEEIRQSSSSKNLIFNPYKLVSFVSGIMKLNPGDVIMTGTPPGVGELKAGDVVKVKIEKIGVLRNYVTNSSFC